MLSLTVAFGQRVPTCPAGRNGVDAACLLLQGYPINRQLLVADYGEGLTAVLQKGPALFPLQSRRAKAQTSRRFFGVFRCSWLPYPRSTGPFRQSTTQMGPRPTIRAPTRPSTPRGHAGDGAHAIFAMFVIPVWLRHQVKTRSRMLESARAAFSLTPQQAASTTPERQMQVQEEHISEDTHTTP